LIKLSKLEVGVKGWRQLSHVIELCDIYDIILGIKQYSPLNGIVFTILPIETSSIPSMIVI
jgi:hypothetical protein